MDRAGRRVERKWSEEGRSEERESEERGRRRREETECSEVRRYYMKLSLKCMGNKKRHHKTRKYVLYAD